MGNTAVTSSDSAVVDVAVQYEIEQFLYREASLLDARRFTEWLDMLADDIQYWMPVRSNRISREISAEFTERHELAHFDEDKTSLTMRVFRLGTGMAWAEEPRSRTRHLISNVVVRPGNVDDTYRVESAFLVYRDRAGDEPDILPGARNDIIRRAEGGLELVSREILLDQVVLRTKNLSMFF